MRSLTEAILYPGVCLLEQTNVSVGRGTERPFEVIGAPWIEPRTLAAALRDVRPEGIDFVPVYFTPDDSTHKGIRCGGVSISIVDREKVRSVVLGLTLVSVLHRLYPDDFQIQSVMKLLGNAKAMRMLIEGREPAEVIQECAPDVREFLARRKELLIYGSVQ